MYKTANYGPKFISVTSLISGAGSGHHGRPVIFGKVGAGDKPRGYVGVRKVNTV